MTRTVGQFTLDEGVMNLYREGKVSLKLMEALYQRHLAGDWGLITGWTREYNKKNLATTQNGKDPKGILQVDTGTFSLHPLSNSTEMIFLWVSGRDEKGVRGGVRYFYL